MQLLFTHVVASAHVRSWHKGEAVRRRNDSVRYVRYFCRADEVTAMPLAVADIDASSRDRPSATVAELWVKSE